MRVNIEAIFKAKSNIMEVAILHDVYVNGVFFRDHLWIPYNKFQMGKLYNGKKISFTATEKTYAGLNENNEYIKKTGFNNIKNIKEIG